MQNLKSALICDKKYRNSFKKMHNHTCWITRQEFTEYGSDSVTGCHITIGRHGLNIKDDKLIIPLIQSLHTKFDQGQEQFLIKHFKDFPQERRDRAIDALMMKDSYDGRYSIVDVVKQMAREYYDEWLTLTQD